MGEGRGGRRRGKEKGEGGGGRVGVGEDSSEEEGHVATHFYSLIHKLFSAMCYVKISLGTTLVVLAWY